MTDGTVTWSYSYNADGLRIKRTNGTTTYSYVYLGGELEKLTVGTEKLAFAYDAEGTPLTVRWNGTYYFYLTNLQGDIIAITDETGTIVVQYTYDSWGNPLTTTGTLATTLGQYNPLRYRGYVYDTETGLYYLQSRYYDPEIGRFINADGLIATGQGLLGNNMFAYCNNNPIIGYDPTGYQDEEDEDENENKKALGVTLFVVGIAVLLAVPTGGTSLAAGAVALSPTAVVGGAAAVTGVVIAGTAEAQTSVNYAKQSKKSGKERATDKPSWVTQNDVDLSKSSQQNATDILNDKYGSGNWRPGAGSEFSKIVKWIDRGLKASVVFWLSVFGDE